MKGNWSNKTKVDKYKYNNNEDDYKDTYHNRMKNMTLNDSNNVVLDVDEPWMNLPSFLLKRLMKNQSKSPPPHSKCQQKDTISRDQSDRSTKYIVQLQTTSKNSDHRTQEITPKHDHAIFCYDQLERKAKQFKYENVPGTNQRIQSKINDFVDPTVDIIEFAGAELQSVNREIVQCTDNPDH